MPIYMSRLTTIVVSLLVLIPESVCADVALKPRGQQASPLRMKKITANATLQKGRFATTDLDIVFQNTVHDRIEADFIYTVPDGAVVTDFAYYYGEERVVAHVVEKERAAAIYKYITSRMRDPALVEMIGKNTFRARIFPVMPDDDLRVQIRYVQTLPVVKGVATYALPIETSRSERLDEAKINVHIVDTDGATVTNNFGIPFAAEGATGKSLSLAAINWRTNKDLKISFGASKSALHEAFFAAPAGGKDGFFALSIAPSLKVTNPNVRFAGITTYDTEVTRWNGGLLFTGRYKGSGTATAVVSDGASLLGKFPVAFGSAAQPQQPATHLWASAHIARLAANERNQSAVITLSKQFNLPSKWTSWLAVPKAELERYHREMAIAELSLVAKRWAQLVVTGHGSGPTADVLERQFAEKVKRIGRDREGELPYFVQQALQEPISQTAQALAEEIHLGRGHSARAQSLRSFLGRLCREINENPSDQLQYALGNLIEHTASRFCEEIAQGREQGRTAQLLRQRLRELYEDAGQKPDSQLRESIKQEAYNRAYQWAQALYGRPAYTQYVDQPLRTGPEVDSWRRQAVRLGKAAGMDADILLGQAQSPYKMQEREHLRDQIVEERQKPAPDSARIDDLEARFIEITRQNYLWWGDYARSKEDTEERVAQAKERLARIAAREEGAQLDKLLAEKTDSTQVAQLTARREELRRKEEEIRARMGDPLITVSAAQDARSVVAIMPDGEIKPLAWDTDRQEWLARFDIPTYAKEGDYTVTIVIVQADGTRETTTQTYHVDVTAPKGKATVTFLPDGRLLLTVDADADTARVTAQLPDGESVLLSPDTTMSGRWFARVTVAKETLSGRNITFILTDRAHNRTTLSTVVGEKESTP